MFEKNKLKKVRSWSISRYLKDWERVW